MRIPQGIRISIIKVRQLWECLILMKGISVMVIQNLYIKMHTSPPIQPQTQQPCWPRITGELPLTHRGWDKVAAILQTIFSNAFSWMEMHEFHFKISLKFVREVRSNNIPALVQIMAWHWPGDKPLSEPMMVSHWHIYASLGLNELVEIIMDFFLSIRISIIKIRWL